MSTVPTGTTGRGISSDEALALVRSLDPEQRADLEASFLASQYALWSPAPGPQSDAFYSPADECFFGGAAGGGKSSLIAGLALTVHRRSLILRRESTQLRGLVDDIAQILKTRDGLNRQDGQWRIPSALARFPDQLIEFGGVPNPGDEERHQGIAHDFLAFDEATQLSEYLIDYLSSWNRTTVPQQRCRILLASNPPTPSTSYASNKSSQGGLWIVSRYAPWLDPDYETSNPLGHRKAMPGELRYFVSLDGKEREWPDGLPFRHTDKATGNPEVVVPKSRTFIPSRVTDNPYLDASYVATLQKHPEPLRSALLYGDFSVTLTDRPMALFPSAWVRESAERNRLATAERRANPSLVSAQPMTAIGVDVARGGADSTVVQVRYGSYFAPPILIPVSKARTGPEVGAEVLKIRRDEAPICVDANGVGASVYDFLLGATDTSSAPVYAHVGSQKATRTDASGVLSFANLRSQVYWKLREALDPASPYALAIPDDQELIQELLSHSWEDVARSIKVLPKKDVTAILGRSPDKADALTLCLAASDPLDEPDADEYLSARAKRLADADANLDGRPNSFNPIFSRLRRPSWRGPLPYASRSYRR